MLVCACACVSHTIQVNYMTKSLTLLQNLFVSSSAFVFSFIRRVLSLSVSPVIQVHFNAVIHGQMTQMDGWNSVNSSNRSIKHRITAFKSNFNRQSFCSKWKNIYFSSLSSGCRNWKCPRWHSFIIINESSRQNTYIENFLSPENWIFHPKNYISNWYRLQREIFLKHKTYEIECIVWWTSCKFIVHSFSWVNNELKTILCFCNQRKATCNTALERCLQE